MRWLASVLVLAACGSSTVDDVEVASVSPGNGTYAAATPIDIEGAFARELSSNLDNGDVGAASIAVSIDDVPLADVVRLDGGHITATVPAGIDPGIHDIVVSIGARTGTLPDGFAVTGSALVASLSAPALTGRGTDVAVTMTVMNTGVSPATAVAPSDLVAMGSATATVTVPPATGVSLAAGASTTFIWQYAMGTTGDVTLTGNATGIDELTGLPIESAPAQTGDIEVAEALTVADDPLGDGSAFAYVVGYHDQIYLGPSDDGTKAARMNADGSGLELLTFTFPRDTTGNASSNTASPPYTSIGHAGCAADTLECGPDNENGRGYFASGVLGGQEWLLLGGAKTGTLKYVYMTSDTDTVLDFKYVDLNAELGAATHGFSAADFLNDHLYLGFPDSGGARPYLIVVNTPPVGAGLDASNGPDATNLNGTNFPRFAATNPAIIDSFGELDGLLYVGNQGGLYAATTATPGPYNTTDWVDATPTPFTDWSSKTSRAPLVQSDITPADRALPQIATFGGHLFFGRNTTTGPQLWSCNPAGGTSATRCEPGDWTLVAPNITGDPALTQFGRPELTSITMVVATTDYLYVGFDSANGVQVYRTSNPAASLAADFEGHDGCMPAQTTCNGLSGPGLGDATDTRILDGRVLTLGGVQLVYVTVGGPTSGPGAVRLVRLP